MQQTGRVFGGMMNADDEPGSVAQDQIVNGENFRFGTSLGGRFNRLEMVESNRLVAYDGLPAGTNLSAGRFQDGIGGRIIEFVWNSNGDHGIYVFWQATEAMLCAIQNDDIAGGLGITDTGYIHSIDLIGNLLYWCPEGRDPMRINIEAALKAKNIGYSTSVAPYVFPLPYTAATVIRKPPVYPVSVIRRLDNTISTNLVRDQPFRFTYRYGYRDGETSTLAMQSVVSPANRAGDTSNCIDVTLPVAENILMDVQKVELVVIYAADARFFVVKTWDKRVAADALAITNHNAGTALTFRFSNSSVGLAVDDATKVKLFDSVPLTALSQEIARNRLFFSGVKMGYDKPVKSTLALSVQTLDAGANPGIGDLKSVYMSYYVFGGGPYESNEYQVLDVADSFVVNGMVYGPGYYIVSPAYSSPFPASIPIDRLYPAGTESQLASYIAHGPWGELFPITTFNPPADSYTAHWYGTVATGIVVTGASTSVINTILKSDASYEGVTVFYDRFMRQCGVVTNGAKATTPDRGYADYASFRYSMGWTLSNTDAVSQIPAWAHYYAIGVTKCLRTGFFLQSRAKGLAYATRDTATNDIKVDADTKLYDREHAGIAVKASLLFGYGLGYTYTEGDVLKIYKSDVSSPFIVSVKAVIGDWIVGELADLGNLTSAVALFEVYTPRVTAEQTYFEVGQIYSVFNPETENREFSVVNGNIPADVHLIIRSDGTNDYQAEAMSPNDRVWKLWVADHGRVAPDDPVGQQTLDGGVAFSNVRIEESQVNGLSSFDALNLEVLPAEVGLVQKLILTSKAQAEGGVMLAIGQLTAALYIGESELQDATGSTFVVKSTSTIGQVNILRGNHGTRHPESVADYNGLVFWYDQVQKAVVQYSQAGLMPVSAYKMSRYFERWGTKYGSVASSWWTNSGQRNLILGAVNEFHNEYLLYMPAVLPGDDPSISPWDAYDGQAKVASFKFLENKWQPFQKWEPEGMACLNNTFYAFKGGKVYVHDQVGSTLSFFGVQGQAKVMVCETGGDYKAVKVFNTMTLVANRAPDYVQLSRLTPSAQESYLESANFKVVEGKYYSALRRNSVTGGITNPILRGEKLRAQTLFVMCRYDGLSGGGSGEKVFINSLHFGVVLSSGHTV